jgi:hypothetical protein
MRAVAILDPVRAPEFSIEGTMFIIIFLGGVLGGALGVFAAFARRGLGLDRLAISSTMTVMIMVLLLIDSELRSEFIELGAGPWANISMFASVTFGYAWVTQLIDERFSVTTPARAVAESNAVAS